MTRCLRILVAAVALGILALSTGAANKDYIGSGDWNAAGNWNPAGVPGPGDNVWPEPLPGPPVVITLGTPNAAPANDTINEVSLSRHNNGDVTVNQTDVTLNVNSWFNLAQGWSPNADGHGIWNLSGTAVLNANHSNGGQTVIGVGADARSFGELNLSDSAVFNHGSGGWADFKIGSEQWWQHGVGTVSLHDTSQLNIASGWTFVGFGQEDGHLNLYDDAQVNITAGDFRVAREPNGSGYVEVHDNASFSHSGGWTFVGDRSTGEFLQTGGTVQTGDRLILGAEPGSQGTYTMQGGSLNSPYDIRSDSGDGTFTQTGGAVTAQYLRMGTGEATGIYTVSGGTTTISNGHSDFGEHGTGALTVNGTGQVNLPDLYLGRSFWNDPGDSEGTVRIDDSGVLNVAGSIVDGNGSSTLHIDGGTLNVGGDITVDVLRIGSSAGSNGSYDLPAGQTVTAHSYLSIGALGMGTAGVHDTTQLWSDGDLNVGDVGASSGTLTIDGGLAHGGTVYIGKASGTVGHVYVTGGQFESSGAMRMGSEGGSAGTMDISGTGQATAGSYLSIGANGTGSVHLQDSAQLWSNGDFNVGDVGSSSGSLTIDGGLARGDNVWVGKVNTTSGTVEINGGEFRAQGDLYIGDVGGSTGNVTLNDGAINVFGGVLRVGDAGNGTLTQTGGSILTDNWFVVAQGGASVGTFTMTGGTLDVNNNGGGEAFEVGVWDTSHGIVNLSGTAQVTIHGGGGLRIGGTGGHPGSSGEVTVADTASITTPLLYVGRRGPGTLTISGGTVDVVGAGDQPRVGHDAGSQGTITMTGGQLNMADNFQIGWYGEGTVTQSGNSAVSVGNWHVMGRQAGSIGTHSLSGDASVVAGQGTIVGEFGDGTLNVADDATVTAPLMRVGRRNGAVGLVNQTGGTVNITASDLSIGDDGGAQGRYNLAGGALNVAGSIVDGGGTSELDIDGGTLTVSGDITVDHLRIGNAVGSNGTYNMPAGQTVTASTLRLGEQGPGTLNQAGGSVVVTAGGDQALLGVDPGIVGNYAITDGSFSFGGNLQIGWNGEGNIAQSGTSSGTVNGYHVMGRWPTGVGTHSVSDDASVTSGAGTIVGELGDGTLNVSDNATVNAELMRVGFRNGSTGEVNQSGGTVAVGNYVRVGDDPGSHGSYSIGGGALTVPNGLMVWNGTGQINVSGTADVSAGWITLGQDTGTGTMTQTGGTVSTTGDHLWIGYGGSSQGSYDMQDGVLNVAGWIRNQNGNAAFAQSGGVATAGDVNMGIGGTANGVVSLSGGTLNVGNDFNVAGDGTGSLNITGGTLNVGGTLSLVTGSGMGSLSLTGDSYDVTVGAFDAADSDATVSFSTGSGIGPVSVGGGGLFLADGDGSADLLVDLTGYGTDAFGIVDLFDYAGALTGVFSSVAVSFQGLYLAPGSNPLGDPTALGTGRYFLDYGAGSESSILLYFYSTPEPRTFGLTGLGLLAMALWRRRRS